VPITSYYFKKLCNCVNLQNLLQFKFLRCLLALLLLVKYKTFASPTGIQVRDYQLASKLASITPQGEGPRAAWGKLITTQKLKNLNAFVYQQVSISTHNELFFWFIINDLVKFTRSISLWIELKVTAIQLQTYAFLILNHQ